MGDCGQEAARQRKALGLNELGLCVLFLFQGCFQIVEETGVLKGDRGVACQRFKDRKVILCKRSRRIVGGVQESNGFTLDVLEGNSRNDRIQLAVEACHLGSVCVSEITTPDPSSIIRSNVRQVSGYFVSVKSRSRLSFPSYLNTARHVGMLILYQLIGSDPPAGNEFSCLFENVIEHLIDLQILVDFNGRFDKCRKKIVDFLEFDRAIAYTLFEIQVDMGNAFSTCLRSVMSIEMPPTA